MLDHDQQPYRAAQIRKWIFEKRAESWEQMTDLPLGLRQQLASEFEIWSSEIAIHRKDEDGTEKLLLSLADGRKAADGVEFRRSGWGREQPRGDAVQRPFADRMRAPARRQGPLQHLHQHAGRLCDEVRDSVPRAWAACGGT